MTDDAFARHRRFRANPQIRAMVRETQLSVCDFIYPLFIKEGLDKPKPIASMPGQYQWPLASIGEEAKVLYNLGVPAVLLFGIPSNKDASASAGHDANGIIAKSIQAIKEAAPELLVITDLCCCEYTSHGHCGVIELSKCRDVDNDKTLTLLMNQAITHAKCGADWVAPSGMMDGAVAVVRKALDSEGFSQVGILGYSVKYASGLYGPFRDAAEGAPQFGDRKTYQMDCANSAEAFREAQSDIDEGADCLMVKPAMAYLDVIARLKQKFAHMPMAAYQVSGEYAMIKAASEKGWVDEKRVALESLMAIKRAGADMIISYYAKDFAQDWQA